jgi:DNA-binding LacI/PurR family transcriptional regulator
MQRAVTLLDVARAAKVSKTTVSNVFSSPERVRPALRERVQAAARELGYAGPDPKGRMLSSGKVNAIGVVPVGNFGITLFFTHEYNNAFLSGVAHTCEERGVGLSLVSGRQNEWGINDALVDGLILEGSEQIDLIEPARRRRLPVVVSGAAGPDISSVTIENRKGAREVTRHLLELGHRRFVVASVLFQFRSPVFHPPSRTPRQFQAGASPMDERMAGVADALAEFGLSLDDMPVMEACGTPEEEAAFGNGAGMALDLAPEATAVIALADGVALSIIEQAKKRGLSVPGDLSVVGFDDVAGAARSEPPLTTVHHSAFDNGRLAARLLLDGGPPRHVVMPVKLVIRGSTAPPRT